MVFYVVKFDNAVEQLNSLFQYSKNHLAFFTSTLSLSLTPSMGV